ncbi:MAG: hypothetical protein Q9199_003714 [Rusavskia elegans]
MDTTASIITIYNLAVQITALVEKVRHHDENVQKLVVRLDTLRSIVENAGTQYGQEEDSLYPLPEQQIRQAIRKVLVPCENDLKKFKKSLSVLVSRGNWVSKAWRQQNAAPDLARIDKSLSDHQRDLGSLGSLLLELTNTPIDDIPPSITSGDTDANTNLLISRLTTLIGEPNSAEDRSEGNIDTIEALVGEEKPTRHTDFEYITNGTLLLEAIQQGKKEEFDSLLQNSETSFQVVDGQDQTPLLLAAHLGKASMVRSILSCGTLLSAGNHNQANDHRRIDLDATDSLGRTVLHYCAEFGMCDEAGIILDHGVNVNTLDKSDHPPMYYAVKARKYYAVKLLLDRGATTDFDWPPESTSHEIEELLKNGPDNGESTTIPNHKSLMSNGLFLHLRRLLEAPMVEQ